jgi:hypothetical protein
MNTPHDDRALHTDVPMVRPDPALNALLVRSERTAPAFDAGVLQARIVAQAALPLAARRRDARRARPVGPSMTDALAGWWRIAIPVAAAAALAAVISVQRVDVSLVAELELRSSDSAALFGTLETDGDTDGDASLADRVVSLDGDGLTLDADAP